MKNKLIPQLCVYFFSVAFCVCAVWISVSAVSCKMTEEGIIVLSGDFTCPQLNGFSVNSESLVTLRFSEKIKPIDFYLIEISDDAVDENNEETSETKTINVECYVTEDNTLNLTLAQETKPGSHYELSGSVSDNHGNTLTMTIPFCGYNNRIPILIFNEIRSEYSKPKVEFIEFVVAKGGSLAGMVLESAVDGEERIYEFPPVDVEKGMYVVLHMRKMEEGCIDETDGDLSISSATESSPDALDLWIDNTTARIGKTDVLTLRKRYKDTILDVVCFAESTKQAWPKQTLADSAKIASDSGMWKSGALISDASVSDGMSATKTLSRQNTEQVLVEVDETGFYTGTCASDWIVVATKCATPGVKNSTKPNE